MGVQTGEVEKTARIRLTAYQNPSAYMAAGPDTLWNFVGNDFEIAAVRRVQVCMTQASFVDGHAFKLLPASEVEIMSVEFLRSRKTILFMVFDWIRRNGTPMLPTALSVLLCKYLEGTVRFLRGDSDGTSSMLSFRVKQVMMRDLELLFMAAGMFLVRAGSQTALTSSPILLRVHS